MWFNIPIFFIIPKFIAIWTIPQLVQAISTGATSAELADPLLRILNVSIPFSLYTSFDYLGFWLYAVFGLLVAGPLFGESLSSKVAAICTGVFGAVFHCLLIALLIGEPASADVETMFLGSFAVLLVPVIAMMFRFKQEM